MEQDETSSGIGLPEGRIDLWYLYDDLFPVQETAGYLDTVLSPAETKTRAQFSRTTDRHSYLLSHVLLRSALSSYSNVAAETWTFDRGSGGKPFLSGPVDLPVHFNLSHTTGAAVCAITADGPVGVDVESHEAACQVMEVSRRYFSKPDLEMLERLPASEAARTALQLWVLREAYFKALGIGLSGLSRELAFLLDPGAPPRLYHDAHEGESLQKWRFGLFDFRQAFIGAVAVRGGRENFPVSARQAFPPRLSFRIHNLAANSSNSWKL